MPSIWYVARNGQEHGPINEAEFAELLKGGHLRPNDYIWCNGMDEWLLGQDLLSLAQPAQVQPAPAEAHRLPPHSVRGLAPLPATPRSVV
jgi:hypothetical protein